MKSFKKTKTLPPQKKPKPKPKHLNPPAPPKKPPNQIQTKNHRKQKNTKTPQLNAEQGSHNLKTVSYQSGKKKQALEQYTLN